MNVDVPTGPPSREEVVDALRRVGMDGWVRQLVLMVQLAAELYPEEIRAALAHVFDCSAALQRMEQIVVLAARIEAKLEDVHSLAYGIERSNTVARLTMLESRVQGASEYVRELVATLKRAGVLKDKGPKNEQANRGRQDRPRS